ncbi:hypothetical protein DVH24_006675 [Malus domestica]|uniref:Uncharacterized protein n=1 Tax=Malus domestica TaxID=3750 RepID=A0A498KCZ9_MALDO|nr:hypothetical protein DVH24_006675 [Malus domestica]
MYRELAPVGSSEHGQEKRSTREILNNKFVKTTSVNQLNFTFSRRNYVNFNIERLPRSRAVCN